MTGPAIPFTSANFQDPGWVFTTAIYLIFTVVSGFSMLFLVEAIKVIPGNSNFQGDVEYGTIINFYFGKNLHFAAQLVLYGALQANAIQCIVLTAQATDNLLISLFGRTCGLSFSQGWMCVTSQSIEIPSPFESNLMVFTIGLLVVIVFCLPLSFSDMDNNITFNVVMAMLSIALGSSWIYSSFVTGIDTARVPAVSPMNIKYGQVVGTVLLNLGGTTVIPTWINLKHRDVNVQNLIWIAIGASTVYYIVIGVFCGLGFNLDESGNLLHSLLMVGKPEIIATVSIGVFAYVMLLPSVPVSFIVSRDNLVQNEVFSKNVAGFMSFVLPWLLLIPLQTGVVIYDFQTWMSLFFCSTANFVIPFLMYFKCVEFRREYNMKRVLTLNQVKILRAIHKVSDSINTYMDKRASRLIGASSTQTMPEIQINDVPIPTSTVSPGSDFALDKKPPFISIVTVLHQDERLCTPSPRIHGRTSESETMSHGSPLSRSMYNDTSSRSSRDLQVVLRSEFAHDGTRFVEPSEIGLPFALLHGDIPDPITTGNAHPSGSAHSETVHSESLTHLTLSRLRLREKSKSPSSSPELHMPTLPSEGVHGMSEPIRPQGKYPDIEIIASSETLPVSAQLRQEYPDVGDATHLHPRSLDRLPTGGSMHRRSGDHKSRSHSEESGRSLPHEPEYLAPPFRVLPTWMTISESLLAQALLLCTGTICFANVVLYGYLQTVGS
ncbi:hypothetical protein BSLG_007826 [Batrachochytrium salamandrivorans]|nr:hypothetical protein BSLG_007826 [Batrachochytrium salamandrivorans]